MSDPNAAVKMFQSDPDPSCPGLEIPGWMTEKEMRWLHEQAKTMGNVVEVGSFVGRSTAALLSGCKGTVYAVDSWEGDTAGAKPQFVTNDTEGAKTQFLANVGHYPNLVVVHDSSMNAVGQIPVVDMVFLDGSHDYADVVADLESWFPKCQKLFCGHDFGHPDYPAVKKAVIEFSNRIHKTFRILPGQSIWYMEIPWNSE